MCDTVWVDCGRLQYSGSKDNGGNDGGLYGKPKREWVARVVFLKQILLIFGGLWNRYF